MSKGSGGVGILFPWRYGVGLLFLLSLGVGRQVWDCDCYWCMSIVFFYTLVRHLLFSYFFACLSVFVEFFLF